MNRSFAVLVGMLGAVIMGGALAVAHWQSRIHLGSVEQVIFGLAAAFGFALMLGAFAGTRSRGVVVAEGMALLLLGLCYRMTITATAYSPQKRTMADIRAIATALEARQIDEKEYPRARNMDELAKVLEPTYIKHVPRQDGYLNAFRYEAWQIDPHEPGADHFAIGSAGHDWKFDKASLREYDPGAIKSGDGDIVFRDGMFVTYPEGVQVTPAESRAMDAKAIFDEATALYRANRYGDAIPLFERYLVTNPNDALANARIAVCLGENGQLKESIPYLQKAIAADATDYQSRSNLGLVYEKLNRPEEGIEWERQADKIKPNDPMVLNNLGWVLMRAGHNAEAARVFERAVRLAPREKLYRDNLAKARAN